MPWWVTALLFVGAHALGALVRPKPKTEKIRPAGLGDFKFPTVSERRKQPLVWGTVQQAGFNVVWWGDLFADPLTRNIERPLWRDDEQLVGYRYSVGFQAALCRGQLNSLTRIWVRDKIVFSGNQTSPGLIPITFPFLFGGDGVGDNGGVVGAFDYHDGSRTQNPDTYLVTQQAGAPGYRGCAYVTWRGPSSGSTTYLRDETIGGFTFTNSTTFRNGYLGNSPNVDPWKFEIARFPNGLALTGGHEVVNGTDANPAAVIYEIITDIEWGFAQPSSDINLVNFRAIGDILYNEGNGFSFLLDDGKEAEEILKEIERQIDGVVFFNRNTGLWQINLARGGYVLASLPLVDETNLLEIREWKKGTWDDTINILTINYDTYDFTAVDWREAAFTLSDSANFNTVGEQRAVSTQYMGVKNPSLANAICQRDLLGRSRPRSTGTLVVNREFFETNPCDVLRLTYGGQLNYVNLPIRVDEVDLGELVDGKIILRVSEDVFDYEVGSLADPGDTGWTAPGTDLQPIPLDEMKVFPLPRAFAQRETGATGELNGTGSVDRIWTGARNQGDGAGLIRSFTRHASGTPSGAYSYDTGFSRFLVIGKLNTALAQNTTNPTTSGTQDIRVDADENTVTEIVSALLASVTVGELGQTLPNLVMIDDEILAVTTVIDNTTHLLLRSVYRGFLDTTPRPHLANAKVYVLAGAIGQTIYPRPRNVEVQLRGKSSSDEVTEAEATETTIAMADRGRAPYPTTDLEINSTRYPTASQSLDATTTLGSGLDQIGLDVDFTYRDYDVFDQVNSLSTLTPGFPTDFSTTVQVRITEDPSGSPDVLFTTIAVSATSGNKPITLTRTAILANNDGAVPSSVRVETLMSHSVPNPDGGADIVIAGWQNDRCDFSCTSAALSGKDNTGARDDNVVSASFSANATGTYTFTIGTNLLSSGVLQVRLNGGSFSTVISTGTTSGTIAISSGDTVEWRHTQTGSGTSFTFLNILNPSSVTEAYGILLI